MTADPDLLAAEISRAYRERRSIQPPSTGDGGLDLSAAYAVEEARAQQRLLDGHRSVGRKVGYANKALWRVLKLDTLVWAHMYDDTVRVADKSGAALAVGGMFSPKIEPEIVFSLKRPLIGQIDDARAVLAATDWLALGFEIIDCVFPDWKYQPADFVASAGLHAALVVGEPYAVATDAVDTLVEQLPRFQVRLMKNGETIDEGTGKNSLRSPALSVAELASGIGRQHAGDGLAAGELISSGTLTNSWPIAAGETWSAVVDGLDVAALTLRLI